MANNSRLVFFAQIVGLLTWSVRYPATRFDDGPSLQMDDPCLSACLSRAYLRAYLRSVAVLSEHYRACAPVPHLGRAAVVTSTILPSEHLKAGFACSLVSGHGGTTGMANNSRLVFFAQVGQPFVIIDCFKSDNRFIVVLPCPGTLFDPFRDLLLLLCGDIEENPGPGNETMTEMFKLIKETNERSIRIEEN
ncbi:hypothetical protein HPB48_010922 [Haemaphysalis longicornis]|uniref:Uncharacterized protein n=1 Tax=Haemaphysalis longicornis TaxID=44386 RepID=A0A9J6H712_HAELO|nr:hypothetical protein HPB48_010922 [Haemaphysalis longicornis]